MFLEALLLYFFLNILPTSDSPTSLLDVMVVQYIERLNRRYF